MAVSSISENPFREGLLQHKRRPEPSVLVLFGASGDLTERKIIPAFYELEKRNRLPDRFAIIGFARRDYSRDQFRDTLRKSLDKFVPAVDANVWSKLSERLNYVSSDFNSDAGYQDLGTMLQRLHDDLHTEGNTIFYLASPPSFFPAIVEQIDRAQLTRTEGWKRIAVEKPFGRDLQSAQI